MLLGSAPSDARMHAPYRGHRIVPPLADAPLDGLAASTGAYSFRKLRTAYAGPGIRIRRASDNLETDLNFLGFIPGLGSPVDTAAANIHCAATSCFVVTLYDQSGLVRHLTNATAAAQPSLIFDCIGSLPCLEMGGSTITLAGPSVTPATGVVSMSAVAYRSGATTNFCAWMRQNGANNRIATSATANMWQMLATGGLNGPVTATEGVWHAVQGVINGASSAVNIDGTETTGTVTGLTTAGAVSITGSGAGIPCRLAETIVWDNVVNDAAARAVLRNNQKSFWGTP